MKRRIRVLCDTELNLKIVDKILSTIFEKDQYKVYENDIYSSAIGQFSRILTDEPSIGIYVYNAYTSNNKKRDEQVDMIKSMTHICRGSTALIIPVVYDVPSILFFNRTRFESIIGHSIPDDVWYLGVYGSGEEALKLIFPNKTDLLQNVLNLLTPDVENIKLNSIINELLKIKKKG